MTLTFKWIDRGFTARNPPNPNYPDGIDLDISQGAEATCAINLPHPTPRCGYYIITCSACGQNIVVTTAGRPDDPRFIRVACQLSGKKAN